MLCIESIRISHAQYPSGNCHVSSKFVSFFPYRRKNRNIWVKIRVFLASPRDTFFTILQSLLELIGIISTEMQIMLTVDLRLSISLSLSPILRGVFFNELPLRDCTSFGSSDRKNYTVPMGGNESSWRERVSAKGKKYRVEKNLDSSARWKGYRSIPGSKGISHYN